MPCAWLLSPRLQGGHLWMEMQRAQKQMLRGCFAFTLLKGLKHRVPQRVLPRALGGLPSAPVAVVMCS